MRPPARAAHADRARHRRGRARRARLRRRATRDVTVTVAALRQRARARRCARRSASSSACPPCRRSSASTRASSSSTRTTSPAASSTPCATTSTGVYNCAADGVLVAQRGGGLLGKPLAPRAAARGGPALAASAAAPRRACASRPRLLGLLRFGRGLDNRKLKATGYRFRYTTREAVLKLREHQRLAAILGDAPGRPTATSARSRSSCAAARACGRPRRRPEPAAVEPALRAERRRAGLGQGPGRLRRPRRRASSSRCCPRSSPRRWPRSPSTSATHAARRPEVIDGDRAGLQRAGEAAHLSSPTVLSTVVLPACGPGASSFVAASSAVLVARRLAARCTPTTTRARTRSRPGVKVGGVALGGLTRRPGARAAASARSCSPLERPIVVHHAGKTWTLGPREARIARRPRRDGRRGAGAQPRRATSSRARGATLTGKRDGRRPRADRPVLRRGGHPPARQGAQVRRAPGQGRDA